MTFTAFPAKPRILSLCSGIGGIDLASVWAGFEIAGQVEIDEYCQQILAKHWPDVPKMRDIHDVQGHEFGHIDLIAGGIPCQPFSIAGKQRGKDDDRYLWPAMLRIIERAKPSWVLIENVAHFVNMALDEVLTDLENQDYEARAFVIPACAVDAPHRRARVFVVAYSESIGEIKQNIEAITMPYQGNTWMGSWGSNGRQYIFSTNPSMANADSSKCKAWHGNAMGDGEQTESLACISCTRPAQWTVESDVGRMAHGIPRRVDRLRGLGNAVVPQQVYPILAAIYEISQS